MACIDSPVAPATVPLGLQTYLASYGNSLDYTCLGIKNDSQLENDLVWLSEWNTNSCNYFMDNVPFSVQKQMMNFILSRYYGTQPFSYNLYQVPTAEENILNMCNTFPGSCGPTQQAMCSQCSRNQISDSYQLIRFCGCYAPPSSVTESEVTPECQGLCSNNISIKLTNEFGEVLRCDQAICVINNVTIQATNTTFNNTSIVQVCSNCLLSGGCKCFIDLSLPDVAKTIGVSGDNNLFLTYCPDSQCYTVDSSTGDVVEIPCGNFNQQVSNPIQVKVPSYYPWILLGIFVVGIIVVLSLYLWGQAFKTVSWSMWKPKPVSNPQELQSTYYRKNK